MLYSLEQYKHQANTLSSGITSHPRIPIPRLSRTIDRVVLVNDKKSKQGRPSYALYIKI